MTNTDGRSRWWANLDALGVDLESVADPWPVTDGDIGLSSEQVRFLEALADQPRVPKLTAGLPGVNPGMGPGYETGD